VIRRYWRNRRMDLFLALLALLSIVIFVPPALAQTTAPPAAPKWQHAPQELIATFAVTNSQASAHTDINADIAWAYYMSDTQEVGTVVTVLRGDTNGYALGPRYELNFPSSTKGNAFLGGDAQWLSGSDLTQFSAASLAGAARAGYKWHIGTSSALRVQLEMSKAINPSMPDGAPGNPVNVVGMSVGFSVGLGKGTAVH